MLKFVILEIANHLDFERYFRAEQRAASNVRAISR